MDDLISKVLIDLLNRDSGLKFVERCRNHNRSSFRTDLKEDGVLLR
jgi:hypothetical protein